jgi:ATP-dependent Clp protease ATP-binding subunit ClpA
MATPLIAKELQTSFRQVLQDAKAMRHEQLTLEHLLLALSQEAKTEEVLTACGASVKQLRQRLETFLKDSVEKLPEGVSAEPQQTIGIERVLQRAAIHALSADQKVIEGGDVLVAMFREEESHALYPLQQEGVTRLDLLKYLAHGIPKTGERDSSRGLRNPGERLNRIAEIIERLKELQSTYSTSRSSTPVAGAGKESSTVSAALEQALPLIEVLELPLTKRDADDIGKAVDDAVRLRLVADDLRRHSRTAVMAAEYVEKAANAVVALREKIK